MSKVMRLCLVPALVCGLAVAGCGSDDDKASDGASAAKTTATTAATTEKAAAPKDPEATTFEDVEAGSGEGVTLGYISIGESLPFAKLLSDGIKDAAEVAGAKLVFCDSAFDSAKALDCAKNFKTQGVEAYASSNGDAKAAERICAAGPQVPVMSVAIRQDPCGKTFMGGNDEISGVIAGTGMGEFVKSEFQCEYDAVISLESPAVGEVNTLRSNGWRQGFEDVCGPLKNAKTVDTDATIDGGRKVFTDTLTALPGAKRIVLFTLNDDIALGAKAAAKAQGRADQVFIAGQGADTSAICDLKSNPQWVGDTAYFPEKWGKAIVPNLIRMAKGEAVPENLFVPHEFVNASNVADFYDTSKC